MSFRLLFLYAAVLVASPLFAREATDVIVMKNGDHITCEIKGLSSNTLYIYVPYILNTLSVDWSKVDHIESKHLFMVKTQDGAVYTGILSTPKTSDERPMQLDVLETDEKKASLERTQVIRIDQASRNFLQRLNGMVGTGFTYSKGNDSTQYNFNSEIAYPRERWSADASYSSNLTSSTGSETSTRNEITLSAQHLFPWNNWYYMGLADFLQSSVQGIQLQKIFGGGIGRIIKNTGRTSFNVYGGLAWQQINYHQAAVSPTQQVALGLIGTNLKLFQFDRTTLMLNANLFPAISEPGRVHFNLNASYYIKLWGQFTWNFTFYSNYDNRPPPGFAGSDYGTTSGIGWTFGNR
jgi:hypothetical protein